MGMRSALLGLIVVPAALGLNSCSSSTISSSSSTGVVYIATQGDSSVTAFQVNLGTGVPTITSNVVATGNFPAAMAFAGNAAFVSNSASNTITAYTVNSDQSLTAVSGSVAAGITPMGVAVDPSGKFLFVANQGTSDPTSGTISVYSIQGTTLTEITGSPFLTENPGDVTGTGPVALAVDPKNNYLYAANQFTNTVSGFSYDSSSGALTEVPGSPFSAGTAPSGLAITPDGNFLYVSNAGSNNVSAFAVCANPTPTCLTPNGELTPVTGSPFPAGVGPTAMQLSPGGKYLFVVDTQSNQISQYKVSTGSGVLTANTTATVSTGLRPSSIAGVVGDAPTLSTGGNLDFIYVTNSSGGTVSSFSFDTTLGLLGVVASPVQTSGQPSAIGVR